jgi:hypothetical protein
VSRSRHQSTRLVGRTPKNRGMGLGAALAVLGHDGGMGSAWIERALGIPPEREHAEIVDSAL